MPSSSARLNSFRRSTFTRWSVGIILLSTLIGSVMGYIKSQKIQPRWSVEARILLQPGREFSNARPDLVATGEAMRTGGGLSAEDMNNEIALLRSTELYARIYERIVAERTPGEGERRQQGGGGGGPLAALSNLLDSAVTKLDLVFPPHKEASRLSAFKAQFNAAQVPKSTMIDLTCTSSDAERAKRNLEAFIAEYEKFHIEAYSSDTLGKVIEDQLTLREQGLQEAQDEFHRLKEENNVIDPAGELRQMMDSRAATTLQLRGAKTNLKIAQTKLAAIRARLEDSENPINEMTPASESQSSSGEENQVEKALVQATLDKVKLMQTFFEGDATLIEADERIAQLKKLHEEFSEFQVRSRTLARNPVYEQLIRDLELTQIELESSAETVTLLEADKDLLEDDIKKLQGLDLQFSSAQSKVNLVMQEVTNLRNARRVAQTSQRLDEAKVTNIHIVSPPTIPPAANTRFGFQPRVFSVLGGAVMGFLIALTFFLLRGAVRESAEAEIEVESEDLPRDPKLDEVIALHDDD